MDTYDCVVQFVRQVAGECAPPLDVVAAFAASKHPECLYVVASDPVVVVRELTPAHVVDSRHVSVILKQRAPLDPSNVATSLSVLNMPHVGDSHEFFERLRTLLSNGLLSYFDVLTAHTKEDAVSNTRKKFNELSLLLQQLQQRIHVPDLTMTVHERIKELVQVEDNADAIEALVEDTTLLNELTAIVNGWLRLIADVTTVAHTPADASLIVDEIHFWRALDLCLALVNLQLADRGVRTSIDILNQAKRFHVTMQFQNIGLQEKIHEAKAYNALLKDFPVDVLTQPTEDVATFDAFVTGVFSHLKKLRLLSFPLQRCIELTELVVRDVTRALEHILKGMNLMALPYDAFVEATTHDVARAFSTIDVNIKFMVNLIRELLRKRQEKFIAVKINLHTLSALQHRLDEITHLRSQHQNLVVLCGQLNFKGHLLQDAYAHLLSVNPLDLSKHNQLVWTDAKGQYLAQYHQAETKVQATVNTLLAKCTTFSHYTAVFSQFGAAILPLVDDTHKLSMLAVVDREVSQVLMLHLKNKAAVHHFVAATGFDEAIVPIVWAVSLGERLTHYLDALKSTLGENWNKYTLGAKIDLEIHGFLAKNSPDTLFSAWLAEEPTQISGRVLRTDLSLNLDASIVARARQAHQLAQLGLTIPASLAVHLQKVNRLRPTLQNLQEHLDILRAMFESLPHQYLFDTQAQIILLHLKKLVQLEWTNIEDDAFTAFQDEVYKLYSLVKRLQHFDHAMDQSKKALASGDYTLEAISLVIDSIQERVLALSYENLSNFDRFVENVNDTVHQALTQRCDAELRKYHGRLVSSSPELVHTLTIENQAFVVEPPLEASRQSLLARVNEIVGLAEVPRVQIEGTNSAFVLQSAPALVDVLTAIESQISASFDYVLGWSHTQRLYELDPDDVAAIMALVGVNGRATIGLWLELIEKILGARRLFDNSQTAHIIHLISIDYARVHQRVTMAFDAFQTRLLGGFADFLERHHNTLNERLSQQQRALSVRLNPTNPLLQTLSDFVEVAKLVSTTKEDISSLKRGQKVLEQRRFKFPELFLFIEQVESTFQNVEQLLEACERTITTERDVIKVKVLSQSTSLDETIKATTKEWFVRKPVSRVQPSAAITTLSKYQRQAEHLLSQRQQIVSVCSYLEVEVDIDELYILEEILELKDVWLQINTLFNELDRIGSRKWADVQPRQLRADLDELLQRLRQFSLDVKQYAAYDEIVSRVKTHLKNYGYFNDLKSPAMKPHHWRSLLDQIGLGDLQETTLRVGDVFLINFQLNDTIVKAVLAQANNEQTIADNLAAINKEWQALTFDFFSYNKKCRLIRNWDRLFEQLNNDIGALGSMKNSIYFATFEKQVVDLEARLNALFVLLDSWIDVQRQWVYLDGVFGSNTDIKTLLPVESNRFTNISYEFMSLLKKVARYLVVMDVVAIPGIQTSMDKFGDSLVKVRKSLSDYLEKQREIFPRFYFVGNEDLLEIIGASVDMDRVNKHFKKMFPGIELVEFERESSTIVAIHGTGERVVLSEPVSLIKYPHLNEWLRELETEIKVTLSKSVGECLKHFASAIGGDMPSLEAALEFPSQVVTVASQVAFTRYVETGQPSQKVYDNLLGHLASLVDRGLANLSSLIIEVLHQRDTLANLSQWKLQQRFYYDANAADTTTNLTVCQAHTTFTYGYEYLGPADKLAYTPLVDSCFLAMTQALSQKLGGSPFGPAGTGKTESVKALGRNLGKTVLVFCCDENFDFQSMNRIFLGLCKVGCWGCFDEFNRLDERILSAVSSQIESIQRGLGTGSPIDFAGKKLAVHGDTGVFITMNPGYVGRHELPENLKKLFRAFSMEQPDREVIADVLLTSRGFTQSKQLANMVVPFFLDVEAHMTAQSHYDFGLRALKSTLVRCSRGTNEKAQLLASIRETIAPKLVKEDEAVLEELIQRHFPGVSVGDTDDSVFLEHVHQICQDKGYIPTDAWLVKCLQVAQMYRTHHGLMLVGAAGCGKSAIYKTTLEALGRTHGIETAAFVVDAKVMSKDELYGHLDVVTRDWTDGLLTSILRKIRANLRGELHKRTWIVFDGDIDPEWAENLNSVLDDNKLLTLPNGERLDLPENVRVVFEVDSLLYTTPATVSRCGMVYLDGLLVSPEMLLNRGLHQLENVPLDLESDPSQLLSHQREAVQLFRALLSEGVLSTALASAARLNQIMPFSAGQGTSALCTLLGQYTRRYVSYVLEHDVPVEKESWAARAVLLALVWSLGGGATLADRHRFGDELTQLPQFSGYATSLPLIDYDVTLPEGEWLEWNMHVAPANLEPQHVVSPDTVVPTLDTVRHEAMIYGVLSEHRPLLLCGPPGSGKTMTLLEALRRSPALDVLPLNFSKDTTPQSLLASLEQHCSYAKTPLGVVLSPKVTGKWVVVFCDEINLPDTDQYGTQRVISLLRQMIEDGGFWLRRSWVSLKNIQFVGACNLPTDPGRHALSPRFLRHACLVMVDYPGEESLRQIYQLFHLAVLKCAPDLRSNADVLTNAMIKVYQETKHQMSGQRPHFVYSPRELTRWVRGLLEVLREVHYNSLQQLARLWYHEGLRLFYDRLVTDEEKTWTVQLFKEVLSDFADADTATKAPVLFSSWLLAVYEPVDEHELRLFVSERLRTFSDEEIDVDLVLHGELLDHCLRIDRVLRQPQGHMILVGPCTSGKLTLTKFVAWMNGLKVVPLRVNSGYSLDDFDATLRTILLRAVTEKVCFLVDESTILATSFVERMNTLLANAEVPGLFEGEDFTHLMGLCEEQLVAQGLLLDTHDELYEWFRMQISHNLHVVFTISDGTNVMQSPALFNRCVLSWMGDWSDDSLEEIGLVLVDPIPMDVSTYAKDQPFRDVLVRVMMAIHRDSLEVPGKYLSLVRTFVEVFTSWSGELEDKQRHIRVGLDKLRETVLQVNELKETLSAKQDFLKAKDAEANAMLSKMLTDQNEAERKQEFSVATQEELTKQEVEISRRQQVVMRDLELAEPAVLEAQRGVQNIKKQHLTEIRSMVNPPAAVKLTMELVCTLIGYTFGSWRDVQLIVRRDDFIANIVNFDNESQLTPELRAHMEHTYLLRPDFNYEAVNRASKACGPLLQWVQAQMAYSTILENVGPLRDEVVALEAQTKKTRAQLIAVDEMIRELEESIAKYKDNYSLLIREAENTKLEMRAVEKKVGRAMKLVDDLTSERRRWGDSIKRFGHERERLVGNALTAAAFITYSGKTDKKQRDGQVTGWWKMLENAGIPYDSLMYMAGVLSQSSELHRWKHHAGYDELTLENLAILHRARVPLVIDPLGHIVSVLQNLSKVTVTSFLNDSFVRQLENALRFGGTLIIQDAEHYNPVLDAVLRGEFYKTGGRHVVRLQDQDIDYAESFRLVLHTRDSHVTPSAFVASRTTTINFTVTPGSLETQILNETCQFVRPDVQQKRNQLMELQGEYQVRLHGLEQELLASLGDGGDILNNDYVIDTLERLKAEVSDIDAKLSESDDVMATMDDIRSRYDEIARNVVVVFELLESLTRWSRFYVFLLQVIKRVFRRVLEQAGKTFEVEALVLAFYREIFAVVAPSLTQADRVVFAFGLAITYHSQRLSVFKEAIRIVLDGSNIDSIRKVCLARGEGSIHEILHQNGDNPTLGALAPLLTSDDALDAVTAFTAFLFDTPYTSRYSLADFVESNSTILLPSPEGYDATFRVEQLAAKQSVPLAIVSMGSKEGIEIATKQLDTAAKTGSWVLIQNIHMSPGWLTVLERRLGGQGKMFLTCTLRLDIPVGIISASKVLTYENQPGLKSALRDTLQLVPELADISELRHATMLMVWMHSVVRERLRYVPISFTQSYDVTDADFAAATKVLSLVFTAIAKGKTNVAPSSVPWHEVQKLLRVTYAGKINDNGDFAYFAELIDHLFTKDSFEADYELAPGLAFPEGITFAAYAEWVSQLPERAPLHYIGLPNDADALKRRNEGAEVFKRAKCLL